jgi:nitrogen regulatory protein P-II 1
MKEIKAYIRISMVENVITALKDGGFRNLTVVDVSGLGILKDPKRSSYSMELVEATSKVAKIELACTDDDAKRVVPIIQSRGCTHESGDGIIFVSPLERAIKIKTGDEGDRILQS